MAIELALQILLEQVPPGKTAFSVERAVECADMPTCDGAKWSSFYGTWVRQEGVAAATARYRAIASSLQTEAEQLTCMTVAGVVIDRCVPAKGVLARRGQRLFGPRRLMAAATAAAIPESGLREDVQMGRGAAKKPSDDGGRGRGPSLEVCFMQLHPREAWRHMDVDPELTPRAQAGDRVAQNELAERLLGDSPEAMRHCFRAGMHALLISRDHCSWAAPTEQWDYAMYSMYGTGVSCISGNNGKTMTRTRLFRKLDPAFHEARVDE